MLLYELNILLASLIILVGSLIWAIISFRDNLKLIGWNAK